MRSRSRTILFALVLVGCGGDDSNDTGVAQTSTIGDPSTSDADTSADDSGESNGETAVETTMADTTAADTTAADTSDDSTGTTGGGATRVQLETTLGDIVIELDEVAAPITTANFLAYVDSGFYDGADGMGPTIFHRIVPGFVIQGGGLTEDLDGKPTMPAIVNEADNGLSNLRGTLAMARTSDPNSATSQFFVNLVDNTFLDQTPRDAGYAVFGEVVEGMEVVDMIAAVETTTVGQFEGVPVEPIVIISATRL